MTQKSYFWIYDSANPGDALSSYSQTEYQLFASLCLLYDRTAQGPVFNRSTGFYETRNAALTLTPSNPAGTTVRVSQGTGVVDGGIYVNTANIDYDCSVAQHYRVVLRKSTTGGTDKTIRMNLLNNVGSYPALTQSGTTWDIPIARAISNGATLTTFVDDREFVANNIMARARKGGHDTNWMTVGTNAYPLGPVMVQCGATQTATTSMTIYFPKRYAYPPYVFALPFNYSAGTPTHANIPYIRDVTTYSFTLNVVSATSIEGYNWISFGSIWPFPKV